MGANASVNFEGYDNESTRGTNRGTSRGPAERGTERGTSRDVISLPTLTNSKVDFSAEPPLMSFDEFLDIMSVFSERAPSQIKSYYAFLLYDFDGDGIISMQDIAEMIKRLTGIKD